MSVKQGKYSEEFFLLLFKVTKDFFNEIIIYFYCFCFLNFKQKKTNVHLTNWQLEELRGWLKKNKKMLNYECLAIFTHILQTQVCIYFYTKTKQKKMKFIIDKLINISNLKHIHSWVDITKQVLNLFFFLLFVTKLKLKSYVQIGKLHNDKKPWVFIEKLSENKYNVHPFCNLSGK